MSGEKGDDGTPIPSPFSSSALLTLPKEVIREIVTYLDQRDLMNVCSVCLYLNEIAADRSLSRQLRILPENLAGKTLHQVIGGFLNVQKLTVLGGVRFTKSTCLRLAKDLPKMTHLSLHLPSAAASRNVDQELSNITSLLPLLTSLDLNFAEQVFTAVGLVEAIKQLKKIERFHLVQSDCGTESRPWTIPIAVGLT